MQNITFCTKLLKTPCGVYFKTFNEFQIVHLTIGLRTEWVCNVLTIFDKAIVHISSRKALVISPLPVFNT